MKSIKLNDILRLENLDNVKIRFNLMFKQNWNQIEVFNSIGTLNYFEKAFLVFEASKGPNCYECAITSY